MNRLKDNEPACRIYRKPLQLIKKSGQITEWGKKISHQKGTKKSIQHHSLLGKFKLKSQ